MAKHNLVCGEWVARQGKVAAEVYTAVKTAYISADAPI